MYASLPPVAAEAAEMVCSAANDTAAATAAAAAAGAGAAAAVAAAAVAAATGVPAPMGAAADFIANSAASLYAEPALDATLSPAADLQVPAPGEAAACDADCSPSAPVDQQGLGADANEQAASNADAHTASGCPSQRRDSARHKAEKALDALSNIFRTVAARHADVDDNYFYHAAAIFNAAHGQLQRLEAAEMVASTACLQFISNPDAPAGFSKQRLKPHISPRKKRRGKAKPTVRFAADSPERPEAFKFFVPRKLKLSMTEEASKEQTAGMRKKAEQAELAARARLEAAEKKAQQHKRFPESHASGKQGMDSTEVGAQAGKENDSRAANAPSCEPLDDGVLHGHACVSTAVPAERKKGRQGKKLAEQKCQSGGELAPARHQPASPKGQLNGISAKRRRVVSRPAWLLDSVAEY